MAPRVNREATSGKRFSSIMGGKEQETTLRDSHSVGARGRWL